MTITKTSVERLHRIATSGSYQQQRYQRVWVPATRCKHVQWRIKSSLKSLDDILGSRDDFQSPDPDSQTLEQKPTWKPLRVPDWAWPEVAEPRVVPLATNALYYTLLLVFVSYYVVQLSDGQESADDLIARLVNDHAAVASGDALRLYTCFFVTDSVPTLIFGLLGMATVASELESLLGYSTFWALISLGSLSGSLADAALSRLPLTQGPGPAVATVAAALLAYHARNWEVEQQLLQVRSGSLPSQFLQLVDEHNTARQAQQQPQVEQQADTPRRQGDAGNKAPPVSSGSDLVESDLDIPILGWLGVSVLLPQEGKAFVSLGGMACAVLAALREATSADAATDWPGLVAGFLAGMWLGWLVSPEYRLQFVEASSRPGSNSSSTQDRSSTAAGGRGVDVGSPDLLLPVLKDCRPASSRANAVLGYAAVLFAAVGGWLWQQGS